MKNDNTAGRLPVPEKILNEVKALRSQFREGKRRMMAISREMDIAKNRMWALIEKEYPETIGERYAISDDSTYIEPAKSDEGIPPALRALLGKLTGHDPEDED